MRIKTMKLFRDLRCCDFCSTLAIFPGSTTSTQEEMKILFGGTQKIRFINTTKVN